MATGRKSESAGRKSESADSASACLLHSIDLKSKCFFFFFGFGPKDFELTMMCLKPSWKFGP